MKSRWLTLERKNDEALATAKKAVAVDHNLIGAQYALGLAYMARGDRTNATQAFNEMLRINPQAAAAQVQLSRLSMEQGDVEAALTHAEAARTAQPSSLDARLNVVLAHVSRQDFAQAEREMKPLLTQFPKLASVHAAYGTLLAAKSDIAGGARELDQALAIDPGNRMALTNRLALDTRAKNFDEGRARLAKALALSPNDPGLLVLAGRFEALAGDYARAEQHLRKSIELAPDNPDTYTALGQLYITQSRLDEARGEFEKLAARRPDQVGARTMVGMIFQLQNRENDAIKVYEEAVRASATAGVAANNLAYIYATRGEQLERAQELAQRAKQTMPDRPDVNDTLGWVYYKRNLPALAIPPLEACVARAPDNVTCQFHAGLAYAKAGRPAEARRSLEAALRLQPNFEGAEEAKTVLAGLKG